MSTFGGPNDTGVAPDEGLALVYPSNEADFADVLLPLDLRPPGVTGLARCLDPDKHYIACRWNYSQTPASYLRSIRVKVTNPRNGRTIEARPVDWGPALWTERVTDLSPGLAEELGLSTDQRCRVEIPLPRVRSGAPAQDTDVPTLDGRVLDARPDTIDFRDRMFVPTLAEVPVERSLDTYLRDANPMILDQGQEGACVGFALATVANTLLTRRQVYPDQVKVSPRMFYEIARRYDEWEGEDYSGSSARGGVKGWHKHGVCAEEVWPYLYGQNPGHLTDQRASDARGRPLGAYFRVNHRDIVAMHTAITEAEILMATARVHTGWSQVDSTGVIKLESAMTGGHAFAIVGYDAGGFWIQNSWGESWGKQGFGYLSYDDWIRNGSDVWVVRLGVPIRLSAHQAAQVASLPSNETTLADSSGDLRPHIVTVTNNGALNSQGTYANTEKDIEEIFQTSFPRITKNWKTKRILLYAHGGLTAEDGAIQRVAEYRSKLIREEVYPLAFIWNSDFWSTLKNILADAFSRRKDQAVLGDVTDFMLDRLDESLETLSRFAGGRAQWNEMKENAELATLNKDGAARCVLEELKRLFAEDPDLEIHVAGHSAGAVFMGPLVSALTGSGQVSLGHGHRIQGLDQVIKTVTLWAPACTVDFFEEYYEPALGGGAARKLRELAIYTLTDKVERDDHCAQVYHKSLLYLVSNAFEDRWPTLFRGGEPILGMERFLRDGEMKKLIKKSYVEHVLSPGGDEGNPRYHSQSLSHGGFDDDDATLRGLLARILSESGDVPPPVASTGRKTKHGTDEDVQTAMVFDPLAASLANRREEVNKII